MALIRYYSFFPAILNLSDRPPNEKLGLIQEPPPSPSSL